MPDFELLGTQLPYGFDLGNITDLFGDRPRPEWTAHPDGPGPGARRALLATTGLTEDDLDDQGRVDAAWDRLGVALAAYGDIDHYQPDLGWVLCAAPIPGAWLTATCPIGDLAPPADATANLARAADVLGLTDALAGTEPYWHLCAWIGA